MFFCGEIHQKKVSNARLRVACCWQKNQCKPNPFPKTTLFVELESRFDGINKPIKMSHVRKKSSLKCLKKKTKKKHTKNPPVHSMADPDCAIYSIKWWDKQISLYTTVVNVQISTPYPAKYPVDFDSKTAQLPKPQDAIFHESFQQVLSFAIVGFSRGVEG